MGKYYKFKKTKSGYLICVVPMCQTKKSTTTLKTFEFPSDLKRRSQWIAAIVEATLMNEEEKEYLEDLHALENRRMELEMEISAVIGDHSYVCARHFCPEDIIVHPNVCRLTSNAVPSIFKNYPTEFPRQFFKKICQTAKNITDDSAIIVKELKDECNYEEVDCDSCLQEIMIYGSYNESEDYPLKTEIIPILSSSSNDNITSVVDDSPDVNSQTGPAYYVVSRGTNTKPKYTGISNSKFAQNKLRKKYRSLELSYKNLKKRLTDLENKHTLYNISSIEEDAKSNNEEALYLLDMLKSYTIFEKTRKEILMLQKTTKG